MTRLMVELEPGERRALGELAKDELRDPRDQLRFILLQELEQRGYLDPDSKSPTDQSNPTKTN